jgi:uncharacterized protein YbbC (DUF1343 family)
MFRFRSQSSLVALITVGLLALCGSAWSVVGYRPSSQNPRPSNPGRLRVGIDVLEEQDFAALRGKNVGLVTNQTGVDRLGRRTIDVLASAPNVKLIALFSPEHGIGAAANTSVADSTDPATGLRIYSLYGATRRPTDEMLRNIDVLVFDIQDAGVRFYTYVTTMAYCMEAAKQFGISFMVLDRPNPLGGEVIEGPTLDAGRTSFTGYFPMPVRYAMTIGELAQMFNFVNNINADLHVVPMEGWRRSDPYDETGLPWIPPSPNLRSVSAAFIYPGVEVLQEMGVSVGRGTMTPFEIIGTPSMDGKKLATALNRRGIPGVKFAPATFTPTDGPHASKICHGVSIKVTDRTSFRSMRNGLEILETLISLHYVPPVLGPMTLLGSQSTVDRLKRGDAPADIVAGWSADLDKFRAMREKYLLYH